MDQFSRTWWGKKFIGAIEKIVDSGRLSRGRSYARGNKVKSFTIKNNVVNAKVRGSVNPYFGVYKEPLYDTKIEFETISRAKWNKVIEAIASKASLISRLLLNEIPDNIEASFKPLDVNLLPASRKDFKTSCSCPDYSNPCKHIAGVHYLIAAELDNDPFLLFELRGLSREDLKAELAKSPLGQALSAEMNAPEQALVPSTSYYTKATLTPVPQSTEFKTFWQGEKRLPHTIEAPPPIAVEAIAVKKQGDFPAFWHRDNSFIEAMVELYQRVKTKNNSLL
ncbi:MAG: SWIM zinc finger family protein [Leptolyngbyaceae bacterium]|nr:SWIM zinc finger family protein [Leptolyngbyaceae bacterium]